jgi:hypothetical protein
VKSIKMTRIEIVMCLLVGVVCFMQISSAAPVSDGNNNNVVDEILMRLKQLRQQSEGEMMRNVNEFGGLSLGAF